MNNFTQNIITMYGDDGREWLLGLEGAIKDLAALWHLRDLQPFENLSFNYVMHGFARDKAVVLKIGYDAAALAREAHVLQAFMGHGVVNVLGQAPGALLLSRASPGHSLQSTFPACEDLGIDIFCRVMNLLHQAPAPNEKFHHMQHGPKQNCTMGLCPGGIIGCLEQRRWARLFVFRKVVGAVFRYGRIILFSELS